MAVGQILGGDDYGQNIAGVGVGAYVPGDENTHENQTAMEKIAQHNYLYQQQKAADEERELAKRKKSMLEVQVDPSGIRPIDKQSVLEGQDLINKYVTQAYASDRDPFDPKNAEEFQKINGMMNAQKVLVNTSSGLQKQIAEEGKAFQNDKGLNFHPTSEQNLRTAATIPMSDYLSGKHPRVQLGSTLLDPADKFDFTKYMNDLTKSKKNEWEEKQGTNLVRYEGTNAPAQKDKNGNEIPGTSGRDVLAQAVVNDPKAYSHIKEDMSLPQNAYLARQAQIQSDKTLETTGTYVKPEEYYAQYMVKPWLTKGFKNSHEDQDAAANRKVAVHAANKGIDQQKEEELGAAQYHRVQNSLGGRGETYVDQDGNTIASDLTGEKFGVALNSDGHSVPAYITKLDVTDPNVVKVYTNVSEDAAKKNKSLDPYVVMPKEKFIQDYMSAILKNNGSKDVSASWKGVEKAGKKEFKPGLGYSNKDYLENTYGPQVATPQAEVNSSIQGANTPRTVVQKAAKALSTAKSYITGKPATNQSGDTPKGKAVSPSKIKSLVGTKGYEGYTEQELIDYYKGLGYEIK